MGKMGAVGVRVGQKKLLSAIPEPAGTSWSMEVRDRWGHVGPLSFSSTSGLKPSNTPDAPELLTFPHDPEGSAPPLRHQPPSMM